MSEINDEHQNLTLLLDAEFGRYVNSGEKDKAAACYDLLCLIQNQSDPEFYVDLYYRYMKENLIQAGPAALGALYCYFTARTCYPLTALHESHDFVVDVHKDATVNVPFWVVEILLDAIRSFLGGNSKSLGEALSLKEGAFGQDAVKGPLRDFNKVDIHSVLRFIDVQNGGAGKTSAAAAAVEQFAMNLTESGEDTFGFGKRSVEDARKRIQKAFIKRDKKKGEEQLETK